MFEAEIQKPKVLGLIPVALYSHKFSFQPITSQLVHRIQLHHVTAPLQSTVSVSHRLFCRGSSLLSVNKCLYLSSIGLLPTKNTVVDCVSRSVRSSFYFMALDKCWQQVSDINLKTHENYMWGFLHSDPHVLISTDQTQPTPVCMQSHPSIDFVNNMQHHV